MATELAATTVRVSGVPGEGSSTTTEATGDVEWHPRVTAISLTLGAEGRRGPAARHHIPGSSFGGVVGAQMRKTAAFEATDFLALSSRHLQRVARDGIEPPTRGFSVRCSTN